jgi:hypothetical protein
MKCAGRLFSRGVFLKPHPVVGEVLKNVKLKKEKWQKKIVPLRISGAWAPSLMQRG